MIVTDEEIKKAFEGTNFGRVDFRQLLNTSVLKKLVDYHCGHTITEIMKELGLIGKTEKPTKKGILLVREAYADQMMGGG